MREKRRYSLSTHLAFFCLFVRLIANANATLSFQNKLLVSATPVKSHMIFFCGVSYLLGRLFWVLGAFWAATACTEIVVESRDAPYSHRRMVIRFNFFPWETTNDKQWTNTTFARHYLCFRLMISAQIWLLYGLLEHASDPFKSSTATVNPGRSSILSHL